MIKKKLSEEAIIASFREKHGSKYEYPPFPEAFHAFSKINIICPIHGLFIQQIHHHKDGEGCPKCRIVKVVKSVMKGREEWIRRFESVHGKGKYSYIKVPEDVKQSTKIEIICLEHNLSFFQTSDQHWRYKQGCPKCGSIKQWENRRLQLTTRRKFVQQARAVHGSAFEYSELPLEFSLKDDIIIYCHEHGHAFFCNAKDHLNGKGCSLQKPIN